MNRFLFYIVLAATTYFLIKGVYLPYGFKEFYSLLFGIIILNFAANRDIGISLESKLLNYLGKISYGIYMFHPIGIVLSIQLALLINRAYLISILRHSS
jgi:peptidoglycan/LPS O-acetylase OafA/YrhL